MSQSVDCFGFRLSNLAPTLAGPVGPFAPPSQNSCGCCSCQEPLGVKELNPGDVVWEQAAADCLRWSLEDPELQRVPVSCVCSEGQQQIPGTGCPLRSLHGKPWCCRTRTSCHLLCPRLHPAWRLRRAQVGTSSSSPQGGRWRGLRNALWKWQGIGEPRGAFTHCELSARAGFHWRIWSRANPAPRWDSRAQCSRLVSAAASMFLRGSIVLARNSGEDLLEMHFSFSAINWFYEENGFKAPELDSFSGKG